MDITVGFQNYVFADVKTNLDEWRKLEIHDYEKTERNFRDKIIELRRRYAKENGLKTVTPICPKPKDFAYPVKSFMKKYIESETARMYEEYRPMAIRKIVNDEALRDRLNAELIKSFSKYDPYRGYGNPLYCFYSSLWGALCDHYKEVQPTLSNSANAVCPSLYYLARDLMKLLFIPGLNLKNNISESSQKVA